MFIVGENNIGALKMPINFWCKQVVHFSNIDVHSNIVFFCIAPNTYMGKNMKLKSTKNYYPFWVHQ